jgi:hypothetical protein
MAVSILWISTISCHCACPLISNNSGQILPTLNLP